MGSFQRSVKSFAVLAFIVLSASQAWAARYIVVLKNPDVFQQIHSQVSLSVGTTLNSLSVVHNGTVMAPFANTDAVVEESLEHVNAIVVNSEDDSVVTAIQASGRVASVEKEFFYPAPKPVNGYALTKPWGFELAYAQAHVMSHMSLRDGGPTTPWGIIAVKAPQAWGKSNAGNGARVAVIDTGIDKNHPAIASNFEQGRDFIHDGNTPYEFADKVGHGTHCAGTIAGVQSAQGFTGVAPHAKILSGRVCSEQGCSNIAIAQGINWAISQKVDVISMSLGGSDNSAAVQAAVAAADRASIVVVAASGNDGTPQVGYPAAYPTVIAVGAVDNTLTKADFSQWGPQLAVVAPGVDVISSVPMGTGRESLVGVSVNGGATQGVNSQPFDGSPQVQVPVTAEIVYAALGAPTDFQKLNMTGKIALIQRGTLKFAEKVTNAIAANAIGVLIYNNEPGIVAGAITSDGATVSIPVASIDQASGLQLVSALQAGSKVMAAIQTVATDYASYSGTSMATPHVAGISALLRAANKNLTGAKVKAILRATAHPLQPNNQNQTGAGFVDAEAAVNQAGQ